MEQTLMNTPGKICTDDQIGDYECALETIGNVIALKARDIAAEEAKPEPDQARINLLVQEQTELALERRLLRVQDTDAIARVIKHYSKIVRNAL